MLKRTAYSTGHTVISRFPLILRAMASNLAADSRTTTSDCTRFNDQHQCDPQERDAKFVYMMKPDEPESTGERKVHSSETECASEVARSDSMQVPTTCDQNEDVSRNLSRRALKRLKREALKHDQELNKKNKKRRLASDADLISKDIVNETSYYFENGLRKVHPYYFKFTTYTKGRWVGKSLMEVFLKEFQAYIPQTFEKAVQSGAVTVNGERVSSDCILKDNDFIANSIHRHELPVTADPVTVLEENDDLIIINKPSSIPIHPCGRYRHNSLTYILAREHGYHNLRSIYRLDRLTSGLFIMCKNEAVTSRLQAQVRERRIRKEYLCRVCGEFPSDFVECKMSLDILCHKTGIFKVGPNGKEASTSFERLSFNGKTSVVKCRPHTGRTHQIRVHLQYLGFPIINDPLYNTSVWGPERGKAGNFGKSEEQLIADLLDHHSSAKYILDATPEAVGTASVPVHTLEKQPRDCEPGSDKGAECVKNTAHTAPSSDSKLSMPPKESTPPPDSSAETGENSDPVHTAAAVESSEQARLECMECQTRYRDPKPHELVMYLHAYRYKGPDWEYAAPFPDWAAEDWKE